MPIDIFAKISKCHNGWVFDYDYEGDITCHVIEIKDSEAESWADMLWLIDEHFGPVGSRHSEERVYIEIRPGDKFMDGKEEEQIDEHDHKYCINCLSFNRDPEGEDTCETATYHCLVHGELMNRTCHWERENGVCGPSGQMFQERERV